MSKEKLDFCFYLMQDLDHSVLREAISRFIGTMDALVQNNADNVGDYVESLYNAFKETAGKKKTIGNLRICDYKGWDIYLREEYTDGRLLNYYDCYLPGESPETYDVAEWEGGSVQEIKDFIDSY